jgi:hypothetical protein
MDYYNLLTILLFILFLFSLFYYIYKNKNTIIRYQTVKEYIDEDYNISSLDKLYKRKSCNDYCSKNMCDNYYQKLDYYKKCNNCQKKFKCFNHLTNECDLCLSFGINQCISPINPKDNLCK